MSALKLRPYQENAIHAARQLISRKRSIVINAPTGSGKTIIGCQIIRSAVEKNRRVLFLAHRRELIDQCSSKLTEAGVLGHGVILAGHAKARAPHAPVQVASIQTLIRREFPPADLIMIDEAHRAISKSYRHILANYPSAKVIGLTATPERLDGKGLSDLFDEMVVVATIPDLIAEGFLVAPDCYGAPDGVPKLNNIKKCHGDYREDELQELMNTAELTGGILANWKKLAADRRTIIFATGIDHSLHIVSRFRDHGISAAHLDGNTPLAERQRIIRDWQLGAIQVVSNVMVLTEGFDFPELECCVLARPTASVALYLQMVGRIMRPAQNKKSALVLDHAGCCPEHGLPHEHREWTLEGEGEAKKRIKRRIPSQCFMCQMQHEADQSKWLLASQPNLKKSDHIQKAKALLQSGQGLIVCPGCSMTECLICQTRINSGSESPICSSCGALYGPEIKKESGDGEPCIPLETQDWLERYGDTVGRDLLAIKNDFNKLTNEARAKGYKRGWVFHRLCERYEEATVKEALPRRQGAWWKEPA